LEIPNPFVVTFDRESSGTFVFESLFNQGIKLMNFSQMVEQLCRLPHNDCLWLDVQIQASESIVNN